jgi:molecular chaperone DnaK (HSP70)
MRGKLRKCLKIIKPYLVHAIEVIYDFSSYVALAGNKRFFGVDAKNQLTSNVENTFYGFKNCLGNDYQKLIENSMQITNTSYNFQIVAMMMAKLKADANVALNEKGPTKECVIAVPSYFTSNERKFLLIAAGIARLDCHSMIKETTAIAISYKCKNKISTTKHVAFVDFGHSTFQVFICTFKEQKLEIIAEKSARIGGREIDEKLAEHFIKKFNHSNFTKENKIFYHELINKVEKLKKKMNADNDDFILNTERLNHLNSENEIKLGREDIEMICKNLFDSIETTMEECLKQSNLRTDQIGSIEIVGGSCRIPKIKEMINKVFGKEPIATMNQDEAVSSGCVMKRYMHKSFEIKEMPLIIPTDFKGVSVINLQSYLEFINHNCLISGTKSTNRIKTSSFFR